MKDVSTIEEQHIIGAVMEDNSVLNNTTLQPIHFSNSRHAEIWENILKLHDQGKQTSLSEIINCYPKTQQKTIMSTLMECGSNAGIKTYTSRYEQVIKEEFVRRQATIAASSIKQLADMREIPMIELTNQMRKVLDDSLEGMAIDDIVGDPTTEWENWIKSLAHKRGSTPFPWRKMNEKIRGLFKGGVYVFAARPGVGKSIVGLQMAKHTAELGKRAIFFSLEMPKDQLFERMVAMETSINRYDLEPGSIGPSRMDDVRNAARALSQLPLTLVDKSGMTVAGMKGYVRTLARKEEIGLVVIDYLQLLQAPKAENRQAEVAKMSRQIKLMARELDVPVVLLSQLNRGVEARMDPKPTLADIRESGAVEQDADAVILLYIDKNDVGPQASFVSLNVAKNRNGKNDFIEQLLYRPEYSRLEDWE